MAPPASNIEMADQLVAAFLPAGISAPKLRKCKDVFSKRLKNHSCAKMTQLEVDNKFDVLQEKLQIVNNDELADAFRCRLLELQHRAEKWMPDVLDLMFRLADDPTNKTRIEWLSRLQNVPTEAPTLTWADIDIDEPVDQNDQTWKIEEYSDLSSDDDIVAVVPEPALEDAAAARMRGQYEGAGLRMRPIGHNANLDVYHLLAADSFWQDPPPKPYDLSELRLIREVLFMLQGCPTTLLAMIGDGVETDHHIRLRSVSQDTFLDIIRGFEDTATCLDKIRNYAKKAQSNQCLQTFHSTLGEVLHDIDKKLSLLEQKIVGSEINGPATILQLSASVGKITSTVPSLTRLVEVVESKTTDAIHILDSLFDHVCRAQVSHDEGGFQCLLNLFIQCFQTLFRPWQEWMEQGIIDTSHPNFAIVLTNHDRALSGLWEGWYRIEDHPSANTCPKFLQPVHVQMFKIGKTVVFLRHLDEDYKGFEAFMNPTVGDLTYCNSNMLPSFADFFQASMLEAAHEQLHLATSTLRDHLGNRCGLWKSLDALHTIYLGKNASLNDIIDMKMFTSIDKCDEGWNDRYVLCEILRDTLRSLESVDVSRLAVKSSPPPFGNMASRRKSVKLLHEVRVDYALHWSVANVITKASLRTYSRISTFLLQIRRARYMLESRGFFPLRSLQRGAPTRENRLCQLVHHDLLLVIKGLYDHLTSLVIQSANATLRQDLVNAVDIDAMIAAHSKYCQELEGACLTSASTSAVHDHVISILDLCIRLSDLATTTTTTTTTTSKTARDHPPPPDRANGEAYGPPTTTHRSHRHPHRTRHLHHHRNAKEPSSSSSDEDANRSGNADADIDDGENDDNGNYGEEDSGRSSALQVMDSNRQQQQPRQQPSLLLKRLRKLRAEFEQHLSAVVVELAGVVDMDQGKGVEQQEGIGQRQQQHQQQGSNVSRSWEMLARRLKWD